MKTTTDNHIDKLLHEAMKQRAAKVPPLADDFAEKVLQRTPLLTSSEGKERKRRVIWPYAASAVAACIVIAFLFWPNSPAVIVDTPVVAEVVEQPAPGAPEAPECSETPEVSDKPEPVKPTNSKRTYKPHRVSKPIAEPQLAEEEPATEEEEMEAELEYYSTRKITPSLLAAVGAQDIRARGEHLYQENAQMMNNR